MTVSNTKRQNIGEEINSIPALPGSPDRECCFPQEIITYLGTFLHPFALGKTSLTSKQWKTILEDNSIWEKVAITLGINKAQKSPLKTEVGRLYQAFSKHNLTTWKVPVGCTSILQKGESVFVQYPKEIHIWCLRSKKLIQRIQHVTSEPYTMHLSDKFLIKTYNNANTSLTSEVFSTETLKSLFVFSQTDFRRSLLPGFFLTIQEHLVHRDNTGVCVRNLSGVVMDHLPHDRPVVFMCPHGNSLITIDSGATLRIWDIQNAYCTKQVALELKHNKLSDHLQVNRTDGIYMSAKPEHFFPLSDVVVGDEIHLFFSSGPPKYTVVFELNGEWNRYFFPGTNSFPKGSREYEIVWHPNGFMKNSDRYRLHRPSYFPDRAKMLRGQECLTLFNPLTIDQPKEKVLCVFQPKVEVLRSFDDFKHFKFLDRTLILWNHSGSIHIQDLQTGKDIAKLNGYRAAGELKYFSIEGKLLSFLGPEGRSDSIPPGVSVSIVFPNLMENS